MNWLQFCVSWKDAHAVVIPQINFSDGLAPNVFAADLLGYDLHPALIYSPKQLTVEVHRAFEAADG